MFYSPLEKNRFGGIEEAPTFIKQGYIRTEESATCMVSHDEMSIQIFVLLSFKYIYHKL